LIREYYAWALQPEQVVVIVASKVMPLAVVVTDHHLEQLTPGLK
jgi:hypothetical protein